MKKSNKAFTLVELLAVIAVLALILIIAVPKITKTLDNSKNRTLELSAKSLARSAEEAYLEKETYGLEEEITCESVANINSDDYSYCNISFNEEGEASVTIIGAGQYEGKYICQGSKTDSKANNEECSGGIPSDILEERHKFYYYSSMIKAVNDVNNNTIGTNVDATKDNAIAGVYIYNNKNYVVLLKDSIEAERIQLCVDMVINLNGNILSANGNAVFKIVAGNILIDGTVRGSKVYIDNTHEIGKLAVAIQVEYTSNVIINGGEYISKTNSANNMVISIWDSSKVSIKNANIYGEGKTSKVNGIQIANGTSVQIINCNIKAYSDYETDDGGTVVTRSIGVLNNGDLIIENSYIYGVYSGLEQKNGTLYLNGGTYESYGYGGIRLILSSNTGVSYIRNATLREVAVPNGYITNMESKGAGLYIESNSNTLDAYVNNCDIYGSKNQISINNDSKNLYISNSRLYDLDGNNIININIANDTNKLYIGRGNNFTKDNTNLPAAVIETNEVYVKKD